MEDNGDRHSAIFTYEAVCTFSSPLKIKIGVRPILILFKGSSLEYFTKHVLSEHKYDEKVKSLR